MLLGNKKWDQELNLVNTVRNRRYENIAHRLCPDYYIFCIFKCKIYNYQPFTSNNYLTSSRGLQSLKYFLDPLEFSFLSSGLKDKALRSIGICRMLSLYRAVCGFLIKQNFTRHIPIDRRWQQFLHWTFRHRGSASSENRIFDSPVNGGRACGM